MGCNACELTSSGLVTTWSFPEPTSSAIYLSTTSGLVNSEDMLAVDECNEWERSVPMQNPFNAAKHWSRREDKYGSQAA